MPVIQLSYFEVETDVDLAGVVSFRFSRSLQDENGAGDAGKLKL